MVSTLSLEVSGLLNQLSGLSSGLENGQPGVREGRIQAGGALLLGLAHHSDLSGCCSGHWWVSGPH
jgi:hypothetical protein